MPTKQHIPSAYNPLKWLESATRRYLDCTKPFYFEQQINDGKTDPLHLVMNQLAQLRQNCLEKRMRQLIVHHERKTLVQHTP